MRSTLEQLEDPKREIVESRYFADRPLPKALLAERLSVTREEICRLEVEALAALRRSAQLLLRNCARSEAIPILNLADDELTALGSWLRRDGLAYLASIGYVLVGTEIYGMSSRDLPEKARQRREAMPRLTPDERQRAASLLIEARKGLGMSAREHVVAANELAKADGLEAYTVRNGEFVYKYPHEGRYSQWNNGIFGGKDRVTGKRQQGSIPTLEHLLYMTLALNQHSTPWLEATPETLHEFVSPVRRIQSSQTPTFDNRDRNRPSDQRESESPQEGLHITHVVSAPPWHGPPAYRILPDRFDKLSSDAIRRILNEFGGDLYRGERSSSVRVFLEYLYRESPDGPRSETDYVKWLKQRAWADTNRFSDFHQLVAETQAAIDRVFDEYAAPRDFRIRLQEEDNGYILAIYPTRDKDDFKQVFRVSKDYAAIHAWSGHTLEEGTTRNMIHPGHRWGNSHEDI